MSDHIPSQYYSRRNNRNVEVRENRSRSPVPARFRGRLYGYEDEEDDEKKMNYRPKTDEHETKRSHHDFDNGDRVCSNSNDEFAVKVRELLCCTGCGSDFTSNGMYTPLQSWACGHTICQYCVLTQAHQTRSASAQHRVSCPLCQAPRAFSVHSDVQHQTSILVTSLISLLRPETATALVPHSNPTREEGEFRNQRASNDRYANPNSNREHWHYKKSPDDAPVSIESYSDEIAGQDGHSNRNYRHDTYKSSEPAQIPQERFLNEVENGREKVDRNDDDGDDSWRNSAAPGSSEVSSSVVGASRRNTSVAVSRVAAYRRWNQQQKLQKHSSQNTVVAALLQQKPQTQLGILPYQPKSASEHKRRSKYLSSQTTTSDRTLSLPPSRHNAGNLLEHCEREIMQNLTMSTVQDESPGRTRPSDSQYFKPQSIRNYDEEKPKLRSYQQHRFENHHNIIDESSLEEEKSQRMLFLQNHAFNDEEQEASDNTADKNYDDENDVVETNRYYDHNQNGYNLNNINDDNDRDEEDFQSNHTSPSEEQEQKLISSFSSPELKQQNFRSRSKYITKQNVKEAVETKSHHNQYQNGYNARNDHERENYQPRKKFLYNNHIYPNEETTKQKSSSYSSSETEVQNSRTHSIYISRENDRCEKKYQSNHVAPSEESTKKMISSYPSPELKVHDSQTRSKYTSKHNTAVAENIPNSNNYFKESVKMESSEKSSALSPDVTAPTTVSSSVASFSLQSDMDVSRAGACYLIYDEPSDGRLLLQYSKTHLSNALGLWMPGPSSNKKIQSFKFQQNGGRVDLIKGNDVANRRKYFDAWCQFVKTAITHSAMLYKWDFSSLDQVDIYVHYGGGDGPVKLQFIQHQCIEVSNKIKAICVLPAGHRMFLGIQSLDLGVFIRRGNTSGVSLTV